MPANLRTPAVANAKFASQERLVMPPVPFVKIAMLVNTVKAKKTTVLPPPMPLFALDAPPVGRPKQAVPNANRVKQVLLVM